ncbi:MAG: nucleoside triphosphate pyrophosphohydrolase [Deltaproteobacteria bacterium]|nr:nucleoside triphosphate pyrophosphohydrolase [Deltaproteobacteria bacterium]
MDHKSLASAISRLVDLVERLRAPDGCPWDAKQTMYTVRMYLLEEAYEVLDAIERNLPEEVCGELGDLLFQVVFIAYLGEEKGAFDLVNVLEKIIEKMIRRHPHVFGNTRVKDVAEVAANWAKIKERERNGAEKDGSFLEQVPVALPALQRAHRLSERASKAGFDWEDRNAVWKKVTEEIGELSEAVEKQDPRMVGEELGDLLFSLVNLARHWGLNAEDLLRMANRKFIRRFLLMEEKLSIAGKGLREATPDEMDDAWNKIKQDER